MNRAKLVLFLTMILCEGVAWASNVILRDRANYFGRFTVTNGGQTSLTVGRGTQIPSGRCAVASVFLHSGYGGSAKLKNVGGRVQRAVLCGCPRRAGNRLQLPTAS